MADTIIVAEIGTSHNGDRGRAAELIAAAAEAGADHAKFQIVIADEIVHPETGSVDLPALFRSTSASRRSSGRSTSISFWPRCKARGIGFFCSAFGIESARMLRSLHPELIKIASPEINHFPLIDEVASYGIPLILSAGVSTLTDIEAARNRVDPATTTLLHCITAYPAPPEEYNLSVIPNLSRLLGIPVGVSDHSTDPVIVPGLASAVGAVMIEKHFTLSHSGGGLDDIVALEPKQFTRMTATVSRVDAVRSLDPEEGARKVIAEYRREFGDRVDKVLGDGVKRLAPSERENYATTRRSVLALRAIAEGETIDEESVGIFRSEKNLRPGMEPAYLPLAIGATVNRSIRSGEGITLSDLIQRQSV